jgi:peptidyl-prolyl cis-trans isomerase SurA
MTESTPRHGRVATALAFLVALAGPGLVHAQATRPNATELAASRAADRSASRPGDYIVAVVNQELVTAVEVELRMKRAREEAARVGQRLPPDAELRKQIVEALIEERVILTFARDSSGKVDDVELDRAVQTVASQNQLTVPQLRARLKEEGIDFVRFRSNLADQLLVERAREREVNQRIRINDADIDRVVAEQRAAAAGEPTLNLAQILVTVPEGADEATVAQRRARAESAQARVRGGEAFDAVAKEVSEDTNKERGGEIGARPVSRLPDLFVEAARGVPAGAVAPALVRSGAGFHVLKVLARDDAGTPRITQTHVRHILMRPSAQLPAEQVQARLAQYRRQIEAGQARFEDLARQHSADGSAAQGGDLGWASPGMMVPEFEEAMNKLPVGGLSAPVASRFGLHLIQVLERRQVTVDVKQLREQARNALREQKFEDAYTDWVRELRARAYVEMREPPL